MKKASFLRLEILWALLMCTSNLAHPITPAFFNGLGFSSSMYGISFAAMSTTYFLFSPLWGRLAKRMGCVPAMALSMVGYGVGQLLFSFVQAPWQLVLVRLVCGAFTCGYAVIAMIYCGQLGDDTTRPRLMTIHGAVNAAFCCAGYFVGGVLGTVTITWVFRIQTIMMWLLAGLTMVMLAEPPAAPAVQSAQSEAAPAPGKNRALLLVLLAVVLGSYVVTGQENSLNYYITSQLQMSTVVNGIIRAAVGALSFFGNLLMTRLLQRGLPTARALLGVMAAGCAMLFLGYLLPDAWPFLICQMLISSVDAMLQPLQQAHLTHGRGTDMHRVAGQFSAARSIGMVAGSLSAGYLYQLMPRLPFLVAGAVLIGALSAQLLGNRSAKKAA